MTGQKNTKKVYFEVYFHLKQRRVNNCSILYFKYKFSEISFNCNSFVALIKDKQDSNCIYIINCTKQWFTYMYQENQKCF